MSIHTSTSNLAMVLQADNYLFTIEIPADFVSKIVIWKRQGKFIAPTHALNSRTRMCSNLTAHLDFCCKRDNCRE